MAGAVSIAAWRQRALTADGAVAATVAGTLALARGGWPAAAALVAFFVTSSALSRFKEGAKARRGALAQAKGGTRDAWQVLANGGIAAAWLALTGRRGDAGFLGAVAAAGADTWATELGLLAPRPPRLLTTLRPVPPGTSGGGGDAGGHPGLGRRRHHSRRGLGAGALAGEALAARQVRRPAAKRPPGDRLLAGG